MANSLPGRFSVTASPRASRRSPPTPSTTTRRDDGLKTTSMHDPTATVDSLSIVTAEPTRGWQRTAIEGATVTFAITAADNGAAAALPRRHRPGNRAHRRQCSPSHRRSSPRPQAPSRTPPPPPAARPLRRLENLAAAPASVTAGAADGQPATVGERFPIPLAVTVTDRNRNPVAGAIVSFTAPRTKASGHFIVRRHMSRIVRVRTNSNGIAVAPPLTANASVGGFAVTATVKGSSVRTAFSLMNLPRG